MNCLTVVFTEEVGDLDNDMDMVYSCLRMDQFMRDTGRIINVMEEEELYMHKEIVMMVTGLMINVKILLYLKLKAKGPTIIKMEINL